MTTITFITGTMGAGKTTHLLQNHFNLHQAFPDEVLLINRNDRMGESVCSSRMGGISEARSFSPEESLVAIIDQHNHDNQTSIKYLFIDEAQFMSENQVNELKEIADLKNIQVFAYGLLTNYKGTLFNATAKILEICDVIEQLRNNSKCWCGKEASHNALYIGNEPHTEGDEEKPATNVLIEYKVMCRHHFSSHLNYTSKMSRKSN